MALTSRGNTRFNQRGLVGMSFSLTGKEAVVDKLKAAGRRGVRAASAGLYLVANNIMTDAKKRSPVDTGAMRGSGYVTLPQGSRWDEVVVEVGFGGPSRAYVMRQHEDTSLHHPVGEAKFLEKAIYGYTRASLDFLRYAKEVFDRDGDPKPSKTPQTPLAHSEAQAARKAAAKAKRAAKKAAKEQ